MLSGILRGLGDSVSALGKFLNKALNTKVLAEDVLTNADETFTEVQGLYEENQKIYGVNKSDDDILALMETGADEVGFEEALEVETQTANMQEE